MKLRPRVLILVIGILVISFLALSIPLYWYTRSALEDELDKHLLSTARIVAGQLSSDLILSLTREPALSTVKLALEQELASFLTAGIEGLVLYSQEGTELAMQGEMRTDYPRLSILLQNLSSVGKNAGSAVSEIYQYPDGGYFKAAAVPVNTGDNASPILVIWGGADFMNVIDQLLGSLFWIVLVSIVIAVSLAIVFSRSLIRPVMQLSDYTKSIQRNIYSETVDLERLDEFGDLNRALVEMHTEIREHEQSIKQLLSGIAHEIKNPLGGIEIYTGLLEEVFADGAPGADLTEHRSYLEKVVKELGHLKQVVLEYLDYARPLRSHLEPLAVESIFEDIHRILHPEIKQKNVRYRLSGKGVVLGDESKLRRVFLNLLKNSLEAVNEQGSITVNIHSQDSLISVEVADDGKGISATDLPEIFDPYFTTQDKGYGLGLAIVKSIVDEMNGTILVESEADKGARFTLRLPSE